MNHLYQMNQPFGLDFMKALNILMPYRDQLMEIHFKFKNKQSTSKSTDENTPYNIGILVDELIEKILKLNMYNFSEKNYNDIKLKHGHPPYRFDSYWELKEVYWYLIYLFKYNSRSVISKIIFNGELLHIIDCFLIRI